MTTGGEGQTDVLYTDVVGRLRPVPSPAPNCLFRNRLRPTSPDLGMP